MPIHDWTRVDAGIFHAFHHGWIEEIARALNRGLLPPSFYALPEQHAAGFGPDVLTLETAEGQDAEDELSAAQDGAGAATATLAAPKLQPVAETDLAYYRRKQSSVVVRHVSGDRVVALVEVVSPGNKSGANALRTFVAKAAALLEQQKHLLILDLLPPGRRDPFGIHPPIWEELSGQDSFPQPEKPLTLAAYESGDTVRAYVVPVAVNDVLVDMPLFLEPGKAVMAPLEATYQAAYIEIPKRWRVVLER